MAVSPCGAERKTPMVSSWVENPTGWDGLLLDHQVNPPLPQFKAPAISLLLHTIGGALSPVG